MRSIIKSILKIIIKLMQKLLVKIIPGAFRKKIKNYLARNYFKDYINTAVYNDDVLRIAVLIQGGYGDILISNAWINQLYSKLECNVHFDIYLRDSRPISYFIFKFMPYKHKLLKDQLFYNAKNYDLKIEFDITYIKILDWIPYRIIEKDHKLYDLLLKIAEYNIKYDKFVNYHSPSFGTWASLMVMQGKNRWTGLDFNGAFEFNSSMGILHLDYNNIHILEKLGLSNRQYVTVHFGSDLRFSRNQVKLWPLEYYDDLCRKIKKQYPNLVIVQVGGDNSEKIKNADINCIKLPMEESLIVLKHSLLHIDSESGLVHMKYLLKGKSIVLFGPTPIEYFKYEENININSPFRCTNCMWLMNDWFCHCHAFDTSYPAECMKAISPDMVMEEFAGFMDDELHKEDNFYQTDLEIYNSDSLKNYEPIMKEICNTFDLEKKPVSENIYYGDGKFYIHASKQWEYPFVIKKVREYEKERPSPKIADVGGGAGLIAPYLTHKGYDISVYDIDYKCDHNGNPELTERTRLNYAEKIDLKLKFGNIFNIPVEDITFDIITCISVVEHISEKEYAINEMLRVLKPGGILIVTYDLIANLQEDGMYENGRTEIFSPAIIQDILKKCKVKSINIHTQEDIQKSLADMETDNVNITAGITVGGFVIKKGY